MKITGFFMKLFGNVAKRDLKKTADTAIDVYDENMLAYSKFLRALAHKFIDKTYENPDVAIAFINEAKNFIDFYKDEFAEAIEEGKKGMNQADEKAQELEDTINKIKAIFQ